ncbi:MAG: hypothetical protein LH702_05855, partial [Phormidesmis sp. CAN_BIN44]|nr:hypothetical protein [Phormidesmis sp. CAN_BIN44]
MVKFSRSLSTFYRKSARFWVKFVRKLYGGAITIALISLLFCSSFWSQNSLESAKAAIAIQLPLSTRGADIVDSA